MNKLIPKSPHPIFAYRFACDYANEGDSVIAVSKISQGKIQELIHPGDYSLFGTSDEDVLDKLSNTILTRRIQKRVFAITYEDSLKKLLGMEDLHYGYDEDGWIHYDPLGMKFHNNDISIDVELFQEYGIELIVGEDEELLKLLRNK